VIWNWRHNSIQHAVYSDTSWQIVIISKSRQRPMESRFYIGWVRRALLLEQQVLSLLVLSLLALNRELQVLGQQDLLLLGQQGLLLLGQQDLLLLDQLDLLGHLGQQDLLLLGQPVLLLLDLQGLLDHPVLLLLDQQDLLLLGQPVLLLLVLSHLELLDLSHQPYLVLKPHRQKRP
jgi:hypothetical protein